MRDAPTPVTELEALTQFLYIAPIGLVQTSLDGEIEMINPMSAQLLIPLSRDGELLNLFDVLGDVAPDLRHRAQSHPGRHGMVCDGIQLPVWDAAPTKKRLPPQVLSLTLLKLDDTRLMAVLSDVSVSVHRERALRQSQAWIETIVAGISDYALITLDREGHIQCWNQSIGRVTGFTEAQSLGRPYSLFYSEDALPRERLLDHVLEARRDGWSIDEGWRRRSDGSRFWGSCLIAPLEANEEAHPGEPAFSLIIRDISDRKDAHDAISLAVNSDHLTGVANRRAFFDTAEQEVQRWQRHPRGLSVVIVDADHFKNVNDRHGHATGDAVLRHLAAALGASFRAVDLVARVGGDEFAVLLAGTPIEGAKSMAARLCRAVAAQSVVVGEQRISYTVSAGVATMEAGIDSIEALMKRADDALYCAKAQGRNQAASWEDESGRQTVPCAECEP